MARKRKSIPNRLREHRRLMRLSQEDVKMHLGLESAAMISRWENGVTMPSAPNLLKLSILYKALVNELYYEYSKELQAELFPAERDILFPRTEKTKRPSDRGP